MSATKADVAATVWQALVNAYGQGGRTRVVIPYREAADICLLLAANIMSQAGTPEERVAFLRNAGPFMDRIINSVLDKPDPHIWSRGVDLVVPN